MVSALPTSQSLSAKAGEFQNLGTSKDVRKLQSDLKFLEKNQREAGEVNKNIASVVTNFDESIGGFNKDIVKLGGSLDDDVDASQLNIPDADIKGLAKEMFDRHLALSLRNLKFIKSILILL